MLAEMYRDVCFASMIANQTNLIHQKRGNFFSAKRFFSKHSKKMWISGFHHNIHIYKCNPGLYLRSICTSLFSEPKFLLLSFYRSARSIWVPPKQERYVHLWTYHNFITTNDNLPLTWIHWTVTLEGKLHSILFYPSAGRLALVLEICHIEKLASQIVASTLWLRQEYRVRHSCQGVIIWCCC